MRMQFFIGTGKDKHGNDLAPPTLLPTGETSHTRAAADLASKYFGGCTVMQGYGAWNDPNSGLVSEPCIIVTVDRARAENEHGDGLALGRILARVLRDAFSQSAVHMAIIPDSAISFESI